MQNIAASAVYQISPLAFPNSFIAVNTAYNLTITNTSDPLAGVSQPLNLTFASSPLGQSTWSICSSTTQGVFCLDQWGSDYSQPAWQTQAYVTGQAWNLTRQLQPDQTTAWRLQSLYAGPNYYLTATGVNQQGLVMASNAAYENTLFAFVDLSVQSMSSVSPSAMTAATTVTSVTGSAMSAIGTAVDGSDSNTNNNTSSNTGSSLSSGATAGIVVGIIALIAFLAGALILWRRSKKRKQIAENGSQIIFTGVVSEMAADSVRPAYEKCPVASSLNEMQGSGLHEMYGSPAVHELGVGNMRQELSSGQGDVKL